MYQTKLTAEGPTSHQYRSWLLPLALGLGVLGLTLSFSVFDVVNEHWQARLESDFQLDVNRQLAKLEQGLAQSAEKLASVGAFYLSSEQVDASEFRSFTASYLRHHAGISMLAWAPVKVSDGNVGDHIDELVMTGMSLPLFHIEPGPQEHLNFGDDLLAIPGMSRAVEAAFLSGHVEYLLTGDSIILLTPTLDDVDWSGVAIAVLPIDALGQWMAIDNWDGFISIVEARSGNLVLQSDRVGDNERAYDLAIPFGAEIWVATAMPTSKQTVAASAWGTLAAGVLITALLLILILALASNTVRAERTVRLRTRELEQAEAEARGQAVRLANEVAHTSQIIASIPSILIGVDTNGLITQWNPAIQGVCGIQMSDAIGRNLSKCGWSGDSDKLAAGVSLCLAENIMVRLDNLIFIDSKGADATIGMTIIPMQDSEHSMDGCLVFGADITDKNKMEIQLREALRLEAVGRLAAGIAHEVNTPAQFVSDNTTFLQEAFQDLIQLEATYREVISEVSNSLNEKQKQRVADSQQAADLDFLLEEVPQAFEQSMDGIRRIADIVRAMKEFSHPGGGGGKEQVDFNRLITNAITVAANEWKYHAEVETDLDESLPPLACFPRELNQVVLNLLINAAHAIADSIGDSGERGKVTIKTSHDENFIQMRLSDTGTGIPEHVRDKIFEPFFTTKEVGRGSGQGLALAYSAVVEQHSGQLSFETEAGVGTTFIVKLPLKLQEAGSEAIA